MLRVAVVRKRGEIPGGGEVGKKDIWGEKSDKGFHESKKRSRRPQEMRRRKQASILGVCESGNILGQTGSHGKVGERGIRLAR